MVYVDRGSVAGVQRGMAVVTPDGIVGKVIAAYPTASQVLLVTDPDFAAGVISQRTRPAATSKVLEKLLHRRLRTGRRQSRGGRMVLHFGRRPHLSTRIPRRRGESGSRREAFQGDPSRAERPGQRIGGRPHRSYRRPPADSKRAAVEPVRVYRSATPIGGRAGCRCVRRDRFNRGYRY